MAYISPILTLMIGAVKKTASVLGRDFNELEHLQNSVHGDKGFALHSYDNVLRILREEMGKIKTDTAIVVSGENEIPVSGTYFTICPIDGFANFAHGYADFAVSAAFVEKNQVISGVVYNPIFDEMYFAEKGCGAYKEGFRNHERLRVAACKNIAKALILSSAEPNICSNICAATPNLHISGVSSLDLARLAAGRIDAAVVANADVAKIAAGILLIKEAGGYVFEIGQTDVRSENLEKILSSGNLFATNEALRQKIADIVAK